MELRTLDENFLPCGPTKLRPFDISWDRKYYETGKFTLQIAASDYDPAMAYVYSNDRPELGMVQQVRYTDDDSMVLISGFFAEHILNRRCVYPMMKQASTRVKFCADAVENYPVDGIDIVIDAYTDEGASANRQETGGQLDDVCHTMLKAEEKAYRCYFDYETGKLHFQIYQGVDRTQSQGVNNFVVFSPAWRNMKKLTVTSDNSNYYNYFIAGGQGEGADRVYVVIDLRSAGEPMRQKFLDMRDVEKDEEMTAEQYEAVLYAKAVERAASYVNIQNVEFDADTERSFRYLVDYDLGDKCDIIIDKLHLAFEARIIEILETWTKNVHKVTLVFGDKIPSPYEKVRLK